MALRRYTKRLPGKYVYDLWGHTVTRQWVADMLGVSKTSIANWLYLEDEDMETVVSQHGTEKAVKKIMDALAMETKVESVAPPRLKEPELDSAQKRILKCLNAGIRSLNIVVMEAGADEETKTVLRDAKKKTAPDPVGDV